MSPKQIGQSARNKPKVKQIVLTLDLGGTNMRFAAVSSDGSIIAEHRCKTPAVGGVDAIWSAIVSGFEKIRDNADRKNFVIAAAVPTTSCSAVGTLALLPNIPALDGFELGSNLRKAFGCKVAVLNDATAAIVGEHWLGAARGQDNVIGVTLGTGVGGGIVINGLPITGKDGSAGELGHVNVEPNGHPCGCGSRGCLEQYASGTAITRLALDIGLKVENAKGLFSLAAKGNKKAEKVVETAGKALGLAFGSLINTLNPEMIVIAGGVSGGFSRLSPYILKEMTFRAFSQPANRVRLVRAKLRDNAGVIGAARLAFVSKNQLK